MSSCYAFNVARVLIVDDDFVITRALSELVEKMGHRATVCSDGLDAIALLETRPPNAVLTDWQMGEISGIDVLEVAQFRVPLARRILVTASPTAADVREAIRAGVVQVLIEKPWSLTDIRSALRGI